MKLTVINFFLLVVTKKNLSLTFLGCHYIFFQLFDGEISLKEAELKKKNREKNRGAKIWLQTTKCGRKRRNKWSTDAGK